MILVPAEKYDHLFSILSSHMYSTRTDGQWLQSEKTQAVIEFLENHLVKDETPQPPPQWIVGGPDGEMESATAM